MRPITAAMVIDAPREQVFGYLSDVANHAAFLEHMTSDFRLEREESTGVGAAARFRVGSSLARLPLMSPLASAWVELVVSELEPPYRLLLEGATGRLARVPVRAEYRLTLHSTAMTRVELTVETRPATRFDALKESLGARPWLSAKVHRALRRMRELIEEGRTTTGRVLVAAG
jgi:uncharacterized protein YndB with AHSA1/START domain